MKKKKQKQPKNSLGINIGVYKIVYSKFVKSAANGKYVTNVILSDVSKHTIPTQVCYSSTHILYGDTASSLMKKHNATSYQNLPRLIGFDIDSLIFAAECNGFFNCGTYNNETKKFKISNEE